MKELPMDDVLLKRERKIVDDLRHGPGLFSAIEIVLIDCIDRLSRELQTALSQNQKLAQAVKDLEVEFREEGKALNAVSEKFCCTTAVPLRHMPVIQKIVNMIYDLGQREAAEAAQKSKGEGVRND